MIYCLNAVSELSQYFFLTLVESGTQIREAAHVRAVTEMRSPNGRFSLKRAVLGVPENSDLGASNRHRKLQGHHY